MLCSSVMTVKGSGPRSSASEGGGIHYSINTKRIIYVSLYCNMFKLKTQWTCSSFNAHEVNFMKTMILLCHYFVKFYTKLSTIGGYI